MAHNKSNPKNTQKGANIDLIKQDITQRRYITQRLFTEVTYHASARKEDTLLMITDDTLNQRYLFASKSAGLYSFVYMTSKLRNLSQTIQHRCLKYQHSQSGQSSKLHVVTAALRDSTSLCAFAVRSLFHSVEEVIVLP